MGAPDEAMLSAQERAALAQLEARAAADDPRLAEHLRRSQRSNSHHVEHMGRLGTWWAAQWARLRPALWGPILTIVGLILVVLGLATVLVLSVVGVLSAAAGLALLVTMAAARVEVVRTEQAKGTGSRD